MIDKIRGYRIYRNLNARTADDTWTVQHYVVGKGWRKWRGAGDLWSPAVTFKVSDAGRDRVLRTGRKNVHAYALASEVVFANEYPDPKKSFTLKYNPRIHRGFVASLPHIEEELPTCVTGARRVQFYDYGRILADTVIRESA